MASVMTLVRFRTLTLRRARPLHPLGAPRFRQLSLFSFIRNLTATNTRHDTTSSAPAPASASDSSKPIEQQHNENQSTEQKPPEADAPPEQKPGSQPAVEQEQPPSRGRNDQSSSPANTQTQPDSEGKETTILLGSPATETVKDKPEAGPAKGEPGKIETGTTSDETEPIIPGKEKSVAQQKPSESDGQNKPVEPAPSDTTPAQEKPVATPIEPSLASEQTTPGSSTSSTANPPIDSAEKPKEASQPKESEPSKPATVPPKPTATAPSTTTTGAAYRGKPFGVTPKIFIGPTIGSGSAQSPQPYYKNVKVFSFMDKPSKDAIPVIKLKPWGMPAEVTEPEVQIPIVGMSSSAGKSGDSADPSANGKEKMEAAKEAEKEVNNTSESKSSTANTPTVPANSAPQVKDSNDVSSDGKPPSTQPPEEASSSPTSETSANPNELAKDVSAPAHAAPEGQSPLQKLFQKFTSFTTAGKQKAAAQVQAKLPAKMDQPEQPTTGAKQPPEDMQVQKTSDKSAESKESSKKETVAPATAEGEARESKADASTSTESASKAAAPATTPEFTSQTIQKSAEGSTSETAPKSAPEATPKPATESAPASTPESESSAPTEESPPAPLTKAQRKALRKAERARIAEAKIAAHRARQAELAAQAKAQAEAEEAQKKQAENKGEKQESASDASAATNGGTNVGTNSSINVSDQKGAAAKPTEKAEEVKKDEKESADKQKADKAKEEKEAADKAKAEKAANEAAAAKAKAKEASRLAAEKARADKLAADKAKAEKIAADKVKAHAAAVENARVQKAAAEKAKAEKAAAEKAKADKAKAEKAAAAKAREEWSDRVVAADEEEFGDERFNTQALPTQSKYYAVKYGFNPGIYYHWTDCQAQIEGYESPIFKAFDSLVEADQFMRAPGPKPWSTPATKGKYYAVQQGRVPGIYTSWAEARDQVLDYPEPRYRKFDNYEEAEEFVKLNEDYVSPSEECDVTDEVSAGGAVSSPATSPVAYQFQTDQRNNTVEIVTPAFTLRVTPHSEAPSVNGSAVAADRASSKATTTPKPAQKVPEKLLYTLPDQRVNAGSRKKVVAVSTDGACSGNGRVSGRAGIGVYFGPGDIRNVAEPLPGSRQTSARAELAAIARALELVRRDFHVAVFSDSMYAVNCLTNWYVGWQRNNWMTSDGRPVENKDIIQNILQKIEDREKLSASTRFEWVRGHNRNKWNEMADKLANDGVKKAFALL